jgi:hypothetical protein
MRRPGTVMLVVAVVLVGSPAAAVPAGERDPAPSPVPHALPDPLPDLLPGPVPDRKPRDPGSIRQVEPRGLRPVPIPLVEPRGPKPVPMPLVAPRDRESRLVLPPR